MPSETISGNCTLFGRGLCPLRSTIRTPASTSSRTELPLAAACSFSRRYRGAGMSTVVRTDSGFTSRLWHTRHKYGSGNSAQQSRPPPLHGRQRAGREEPGYLDFLCGKWASPPVPARSAAIFCKAGRGRGRPRHIRITSRAALAGRPFVRARSLQSAWPIFSVEFPLFSR